METYLAEEVLVRIEQAIAQAELQTSAEIRVHIEDECTDTALDRAVYVFTSLKMHETAQRNGILIYIAMENRKAAVIGDKGIHEKVAPSYWNDELHLMLEAFKNNQHELGICRIVENMGRLLARHFPIRLDDVNELSNKVTNAKDLTA
jgi:uncharacterized membrane protein